MNPSYGKLVNGAIIHAPTSLNTPSGVIMNPKRLSYLQAGWKFLDLQPPVDPPPEGKVYRISGYTETATDIRPIFKLVPVVSPPPAPASPSPTPKSPCSSPMPLPHKGTITTWKRAAFCHFPLFEKSVALRVRGGAGCMTTR